MDFSKPLILFKNFWDHLSRLIKRCQIWYNLQMKDLYQILGVSPTAAPDELKSAYRKLAQQWHPDRNRDPGASDRFKEINEAYSTLSDSAKRQAYDQEREWAARGGSNFGNFQFHTNFDGDIRDLFANMFGGGGFRRPARNGDTHVQIEISLEESFSGKSIPVQFNDSSGQTINLTVNLQPGVEHGTRLRYAGNGSRVNPSLPPGDLVVFVTVRPHSLFERSGPHLVTNLELSLWECLVGSERTVTGVDGVAIRVQVPPMSRDQTTLRVPGKGMPIKGNVRARGDLYCRVQTQWPTSLSQEQQSALERWKLL
jgi:curved DNA-binding protein